MTDAPESGPAPSEPIPSEPASSERDSEPVPSEPSPSETTPSESAEPVRSKKRRRKKRAASDDKRPLFARAYPQDPQLDRLVAAFAAGDFGMVRSDAAALAAGSDSEAVRAAAADLRRRIEPHPSAVVLWALGLALLLLLYGYFVVQGH